MKLLLLGLCCLVSLSLTEDINSRYFPENFKLGVANAAPQIEGAWDEDGKGETIWDYFAHNHPEMVADAAPDVACDSYHKYKEDVALVKKMGLDYYRLSIAWSRILPTGYVDEINQPGVEYYKNLFAELKANDIEPVVTLYHWDLPQPLQESLGGWLNSEVADIFAQYADLCFELFGDDVKTWTSINEPKQICIYGYGTGGLAPGIVSRGVGDYECSRNVLLAHAKAYHIYDEKYRETQGGKITIVVDTAWFEPGTDSEEDKEAAERTLQFTFGLYANPVFIGNWPQIVIDRVANRSELEGYEKSRLPAFTEEEIAYIKGTYDFMAINHYTTNLVNATAEREIGDPSVGADQGTLEWADPSWIYGPGSWIAVVPWGLRKLLNWVKDTYGDMEIFITENGLSDTYGMLEDDHRVSYFQQYISACLDAIYTDKVNLTAYLAWSIIDDFEWNAGYSAFLGMYRVNFSDPERTRTPRTSAGYFTNITKNRCLVDECTN